MPNNSLKEVYSVSDLVNEMRRLMERSYPQICIEGEISSLSKPASGHLYFTLKDDQSNLRCAMFRNRVNSNRYQARAGDLVRVWAKISVYSARGDLQCIVHHIEDAGEGVLQRQINELKEKLNAEGLFAHDRKQSIPTSPQCIGIITSATGAAIQDVLTTLERRSPTSNVIIYPAQVQGVDAVGSINAALQDAIKHNQCDVLLLTRGGGSMEDLWAFNDEHLVRAVFACPIPVMSAVGHEVDFTILDLVADSRAPTPTAAAELLSSDQNHLVQNIKTLGMRIESAFRRKLQNDSQTVDLWFSKLTHPKEQLQHQTNAISNLATRLIQLKIHQLRSQTSDFKAHCERLLRQHPHKLVKENRIQLQNLSKVLYKTQKATVNTKKQLLTSFAEQLQLVSPLATLSRGYAIAKINHHDIVRSASSVALGDTVNIQLNQGQIDCKVINTSPLNDIVIKSTKKHTPSKRKTA